jgi:uncharacterized cupin superfamily protein
MTNVQDRLLPLLPAAISSPIDLAEQAPGEMPQTPFSLQGFPPDRIRPLMGPAIGAPVAFEGDPGPFVDAGCSGQYGFMGRLIAMLGEMLSSLRLGNVFGAGSPGQPSFANASASSAGDPHLEFDGTMQSGQTERSKFDSMCGHVDLLDSGSFAGGYRISTMTTVPNAAGVTYNQEAAVSTDDGETRVSLDDAGQAYVIEGSQRFALAGGQSVQLGHGEYVSRAASGSVTVSDDNGYGGSISTVLSENGNGVDVRVSAQNVRLGGDLLRGR